MTLVLVGKQRGTLISGSTYSIPAPPSSPGSSLPPLSVLGWLPLRRRQKPGALTGARLWVLSSPPGGFLAALSLTAVRLVLSSEARSSSPAPGVCG